MFKSIRKKQLGVQLLEYGLLGAIMVGGGAYATTQLSNQSVDKTDVLTACVGSVGAAGDVAATGAGAATNPGKASAAECKTTKTSKTAS